MTTLTIKPLTIPAADLGPENPLPYFREANLDHSYDYEANNIPESDRLGLGWQTGRRVLPYRMQDGYNRKKKPRDMFSIILENDHLRATVLPEVGGKIVSVVYKPLDRDLLNYNPVFQPANLALRNAWTSGGIEWNTAQLGHNYLTCAPMHTARIASYDGSPAVRIYAWDRVKRFPYQIDIHLPNDSRFLFFKVSIINPHDQTIPMYWWTNMAVPEYPNGRVLCPTNSAYRMSTVGDCPVIDGVDNSYPTRLNRAYDLFFRIPPDQRPWEASIDDSGTGIIHTSTRTLRGRKLFAWGMGHGGRHWQEYLSVPNNPYIEIQAGLAYTQMHSIPMPAHAQWSWTEAIGYFESDPCLTHSPDWSRATAEAERILASALPESELEHLDKEFAGIAGGPVEELLFKGLGWASLEQARCAKFNHSNPIPQSMPFSDEEIGDDQRIWFKLLQTGALPERNFSEGPGHYMVQPEWVALLEKSMQAGRSDHWFGWYHLGVMRMEDLDIEGAKAAWTRSNELTPNGWSLRNLALIEQRGGNESAAHALMRQAWETGPKVTAIAIEYAQMLQKLELYEDLGDMIDSLPDGIRANDRIVMAEIGFALHHNNFERVEQLLQHEFATIQEGELKLTDIWYDLQARKLAASEGVPVDDDIRERARRTASIPGYINFGMSDSDAGAQYIPPQAGGQ